MELSENTQKVFINYTYQTTQKELDEPETLSGFNMTHPNGQQARFMRITDWEQPSKEDVSESSGLNQSDSRQ